jgi:hypothetical protein
VETTETEPSRIAVVGFEGKRWKEFFVLVIGSCLQGVIEAMSYPWCLIFGKRERERRDLGIGLECASFPGHQRSHSTRASYAPGHIAAVFELNLLSMLQQLAFV